MSILFTVFFVAANTLIIPASALSWPQRCWVLVISLWAGRYVANYYKKVFSK